MLVNDSIRYLNDLDELNAMADEAMTHMDTTTAIIGLTHPPIHEQMTISV